MLKNFTNIAISGVKSLMSPSMYYYSKLTNEIKFTASFNQRMQEISNKTGNFLRLKVDTGKGCGGFQYEFEMEKKANDNDLAYLINDKILFACDDFSFQLIKGCTLDFIDSGISSTFKVLDNPNAKFLCHCENSFHPTDEILQKIKK